MNVNSQLWSVFSLLDRDLGTIRLGLGDVEETYESHVYMRFMNMFMNMLVRMNVPVTSIF